ncbi:ATP-binding protein [Teredinibacter purpureus]|uniref:ATP-binding protein n=1 Tax=Teredinibacter purpureus TaxID=2731756 RepID=UPI0005F83BEC|nr:ATP-binding protein [Teredinibacter purpureus]
MKLRKQLWVVSLITLTLPWVGCQYIREMENTLRQGQTEALGATAQAVAARLGSDPQTVASLTQLNPPSGSVPLYAHRLLSAPIIDAYNDEWLAQFYSLQILRGDTGNSGAKIIAGTGPNTENARLFLFIQVNDQERHYFDPTLPSPLHSDHILLHIQPSTTGTTQYQPLVIYATGPGDLQTAWLRDDGTLERDFWVSGISSEWRAGYQLELSIPLSWAEKGVGIEVFDAGKHNTHRLERIASNLSRKNTVPPLINQSATLSRELDIFTRNGIQLHIASRGGRPIATAGSLSTNASHQLNNRHSFINWFYRTALGTVGLPQLGDSRATGLLDTPEIYQSLGASPARNGVSPQGWYQHGTHKLARVTAPIFNLSQNDLRDHGDINASSANIPIAVVVADQSADGLASLTSSAFYRLLFYSLIVTFAASLSLILYASWLSLRIRRLSLAAANAISDSGKIVDEFPVFKSQDELGDLSRNYATLLMRLREYTNYLRSLSSKLSHELRTPLAIVKSSLENLEHEPLSPQATTYAERAKEGTNRLSNILNAMSAASRVEQAIGAAELETIPCDELLGNLKGAYEDVYRQATFKLNIRHDEGPLKLLASGELLVQMFDKLVDNAADFCPKNGKIELGLYRQRNDIVFTVHNEGPPLPKHMHGQLFDSMVSVRDKPTKPDNGQHLGLGLYIVRLIADFHRGEVQCYNLPHNSGVMFEVRLPIT